MAFASQYSMLEELGRGSYAVVHKCVNKNTGQNFAVKLVNKQKATKSQLEDIASEVSIMKTLKHKYVISLKDVLDTPPTMYIVLELVMGGDLFHMITKLKHYSESVAATLMANFMNAMEYIHNMDVCHRDLKPDNMLLTYSSKSATYIKHERELLTNLKVADFGFATKAEGNDRQLTKCCGTPYYIAPEVLNCGLYKTGPPYGKECDLWSCGVICYVLLCGFPPFQAQKRDQLFKYICKGSFKYPSGTVWDQISPLAKDFINKLLVTDPNKRLTAKQCLQHEWITNHELQSNSPLPGLQQALRKFNAKCKLKGAVYGVEAVNRLVYLQACKATGTKPNSKLVADMEGRRGNEEADVLDLSNNYVGKKGVQAVMGLVASKKKLKKLVLQQNEIENTSIDTIVRTLEKHPSVTHIDFSKNPLSRTAAKKLIGLLERNTNIIKMDLHDTEIHPDKVAQIDSLLERNRTRKLEPAAQRINTNGVRLPVLV